LDVGEAVMEDPVVEDNPIPGSQV
jgi:hypothetical protein